MNPRGFDVARFHADYDARHPNDRARLFGAVVEYVDGGRVLYPGSYVDIAPSIYFDDVTYVDTDRRAARFFGVPADVAQLVRTKRADRANARSGPVRISFHQLDYTGELPLADRSFDLLISMYAGFVSEHCSHHLRCGGHLLVNPSHGDASMAGITARFQLAAVIECRDGDYRVRTDRLDRYLVPKRGTPPTVDELHDRGRGIAYTLAPFAYLFRAVEP